MNIFLNLMEKENIGLTNNNNYNNEFNYKSHHYFILTKYLLFFIFNFHLISREIIYQI